MSNCSCDALHSLSTQACQFSIGKRVGQIQHSLYSSPSVRRVALGTQNLSPDNGSGCYDLVHSTLMAAFEGRIPEVVKTSCESSKLRLVEDDEDDLTAPIVEPSGTVLWWDRATQQEESQRSPSVFSVQQDISSKPTEVKPVDWVSYVDQIEEETAMA